MNTEFSFQSKFVKEKKKENRNSNKGNNNVKIIM